MHVFVSGNVALDFIGTLKWRRRDTPEELLSAPADLDAWLTESGVLTSAPGSLESDLAIAVELREAIYRLVSGALAGGAGRPADLAVLNRRASVAPVTPTLVEDGRGGRRVELSGTVDNAISTVARSAIEALAHDLEIAKECGRDECTRIYLDRSRGLRRNWCGMDECGNRVKAAAYRQRLKERASA